MNEIFFVGARGCGKTTMVMIETIANLFEISFEEAAELYFEMMSIDDDVQSGCDIRE